MSHVTTKDGAHLNVKDWGTGRPVILIHGWPLSADTWDDVAMAIASSGMRAIAYDRRGFGRSSQPWGGYDYDTLSDDLAAVIEYAGGSEAVIVGFSMGGGEVARYMSRHEGRGLRGAALISSVVPYMMQTTDNPDGVKQSVFDEMTLGLKKDRAAFFSDFFKMFYGEGLISHPVSTEVLAWSRHLAMMAALPATLLCAAAFATTDFRRDLSSFTVPTLIVHGTSDKVVPIDATGRAAARAISGATLLEYDGAPHGVLASHKTELTKDLLEFLAR